ncbi:hypothetical protein [Mesorhizobium sp. YR577]|uniref:hypothetical protein n=1 Tax=Mesorhizobium sp. YR577 TaxID=1884373 RepID=UPI0008EC23C4|nr:hypothetical protein [Mesorhizobium sp. YR577]SFT85337.1 hypothetical protein SAMN05518861_106153 [Mesorhizobium sp. YR577]
MLNIFKTAALSAFIGLGAISAMPAAAHADGLYLNFGGGDDGRVGVYVRDGEYRRHHRDRWDRREERRDRWERRDDRWDRPSCSPDRAVNKAERMGLHRARVVDVSRRTITVGGRKWGERMAITFGRSPNCPVLR